MNTKHSLTFLSAAFLLLIIGILIPGLPAANNPESIVIPSQLIEMVEIA